MDFTEYSSIRLSKNDITRALNKKNKNKSHELRYRKCYNA